MAAKKSSRINSTSGGKLIDMVHCSAIFEIITKGKLVNNPCHRAKELLLELEGFTEKFPTVIRNARGTHQTPNTQ